MLHEFILAICLTTVPAEIEAGDKVVTLTAAPVMIGSKEVAEVDRGAELTVTSVKTPWIGVTVTRNGEEIKGWVLDRNVVTSPTDSGTTPPSEAFVNTDRSKASEDSEKRVAEMLVRLGAWIKRNERGKIRIVNLSGKRISDDHLAALGDLTELELLWLNETKVTDAGLAHVENLKSLKTLYVEGAMLSQTAANRLREPHTFRTVGLSKTHSAEQTSSRTPALGRTTARKRIPPRPSRQPSAKPSETNVMTNRGSACPISEQVKAATARLKTVTEPGNAGDLAEIGRLLEAGADVNVRNKFGVTPLMMASKEGHAEIVKLLLANEADVNAAHTDGRTPLMVASYKGHAEIVKLLLANKADVNAAHTDGRTPLFVALLKGHAEIVKLLLANKADVNAAPPGGFTPLMVASYKGHAEIVKLLLANKADVNAADTMNGVTPLFVASQEGHTEVVKLLLANRADVNAAPPGGVTPLFMASLKGHAEIVKLLLANKADVNAAEKTDDATLFRMTFHNGHTEVVEPLLANKADVNAAHTAGRTPLMMASQEGHAEIVKLLLAAGADVHAKARIAGKDYTPLSVAKDGRIIELLKEHGATE